MSDALHRISLDVTSPRIALGIIREALDASIDEADAVRHQLAEKIWQLIKKPGYDMDEMASWHDLLSHIGALVSHRGDPATGVRIVDLAHLLSRDSRFRQLQPLEEVVKRRTARAMLAELEARGGSCSCIELAGNLGLGDALMSKQTLILGINGLIERKGFDENATVSITDLGRSFLGSAPHGQDVA